MPVIRGLNKVKQLLLKALLIIAPALFSNGLFADDLQQAEMLVNQYHQALQGGDTATILSLMGVEEARVNAHLKELRYQGLLQAEFQGSTLEVLKKESKGDFYVFDIEVHLDPSGIVTESLLIKKMETDDRVEYFIFKKSPL